MRPGLFFASAIAALLLSPTPGVADPGVYEPGADPAIGFNLVSWFNFGSAGAEIWEDAVEDIHAHGFTAVSISPLRFVDLASGEIRLSDGQTTGPDLAHIAAAVGKAKSLGMTVTVNSFVEPHRFSKWRGEMNFSGAARTKFWNDYRDYLVEVAAMAAAEGADRMLVGTELRDIVRDTTHNSDWANTIDAVDAVFSGSLGYASNWDNYPHPNLSATIWANPKIDFLGVDAYFPLASNEEATGVANPAVALIEDGWNDVLDVAFSGFNHGVMTFAAALRGGEGLPVVMTEHGTIPYDRTTAQPYAALGGATDPYEQRNDYEALMRAVDGRAAADAATGRLEEIHIWQWGMPGAEGSRWYLDPEGDDVVEGAKAAQFLVGFVAGVIPEPGTPQTKTQTGCIAALSKDAEKVFKAQTKEVLDCVVDFARARLPIGMSAEACLVADRRERVAKAQEKTVENEDKRCSLPVPDFGHTGSGVVNAAAVQHPVELAHEIFGVNLDAGLAADSSAQALSQCQRSVLRATQQCTAVRVKEFNRCKKRGLAENIDSTERLALCLGLDSKGKIAKSCDTEAGSGDRIRKAVAKRCTTGAVDLSTAIPGCGTTDAEFLHDCLDAISARETCLFLTEADALGTLCD